MEIPDRVLRGNERLFPIEVLFTGRPPAAAEGERTLLSLTLPPFQRGEVWAEEQKRAFIEGALLGFGLGSYVVNKADWNADGSLKPCSGWLIDGQQRISAIRDFVRGDLAVFGGQTYGDFSSGQAQQWLNLPFTRFELDYIGDPSVLADLYDRLNFGGTPHRPEEAATPRVRAAAFGDVDEALSGAGDGGRDAKPARPRLGQ